MNLSYWLNLKDDLLLTASNRQVFHDFMGVVARFHYQIGIVSEKYPLLSSLNVLENITLMNMYHQNLSLRRARRTILPLAEALDMADALYKKKEDLGREEALKTYLLRCVAKNNMIILLNTPRLTDIRLMTRCLETLGRRMRMWILCLEQDAEIYHKFNLRTFAIDA